MTDETDATQGVPEGDTAATPEIETSATGTETEATTTETTEQDDKPKQKPWFQRRIDELTRQKYEEARRADALAETIKALREAQDPQEGEKLTRAEAEALAEKKARQIAAEQAFTDECNRIYEAGVKAFSDFHEAVSNFQMVGGLNPAVIEAAAATGMPEKVLYELGSDPERAEKVLKMTPGRLGVEIAKIAAALEAPKKAVSKAPAPIKPVEGSGTAEKDPDQMSDREWMEWRNKQVAANRA